MTELEQLRAENAALKTQVNQRLTVKISPKGAIMVAGLGKFPTTLYKEQWIKLLAVQDKIREVCATAPDRKYG